MISFVATAAVLFVVPFRRKIEILFTDYIWPDTAYLKFEYAIPV